MKELTPNEYEDEVHEAMNAYLAEDYDTVDETRQDVINALMSVAQIIGLQILTNHGKPDSYVVSAAKHLDLAQQLLDSEWKYLRNQDEN